MKSEASRRRCTSGLVLLGLLALTALTADRTEAATPANASSPLGINLMQVTYYSAEQPFLDVFKTSAVSHSTPAAGWVTHTDSTWDTHEEAYLQLDRDGYPRTLKASAADPNSPQLFNSVGLLLLRNLPRANAGTGPPYRPGRYVVLYEGQGRLSYGLDARLDSSSPGRDVIDVAPTYEGGIDLRITDTDPHHTGDHLRNIRVVKAEEERLLKAGQVFRPDYLSLLGRFRIVRGMEWLDSNSDGGSLQDWTNRPLPTDGGWGSDRGVPVEVLLQLCVAVDADCWLNVPHRASDDYIAQMARLAHGTLRKEQKAYIEFSNEVWNSSFPQYDYAVQQGRIAWPAAGASPFELNRSWYGMRTAQTCDIWKSTWGADAARVVCVLGAQSANAETATKSLDCPLWRGTRQGPCADHHIDAVAIAPYFGDAVPDSWTSQPDGGLARLFTAMTRRNDSSVPEGGWLADVSRQEAAYHSRLAPYKLELIGYEGGQSFVGHPRYREESPVVNLYIAANRDALMGTAYTSALNDWRRNGGHALVLFGDIYGPSQYGEWGALESFLDTVDPLSKAPPKWQAIQRFITDNPCWWPGCTGPVAPTAAPAATSGRQQRTPHCVLSEYRFSDLMSPGGSTLERVGVSAQ